VNEVPLYKDGHGAPGRGLSKGPGEAALSYGVQESALRGGEPCDPVKRDIRTPFTMAVSGVVRRSSPHVPTGLVDISPPFATGRLTSKST